ncbi:hypothetical protein CANINC_003147 [Pichia inconspicua]|uniref:Carbohydrate kinase PfkB domain-containing protein n=1 Tax=Pichia inconspicua TaxID=52247 RepID=A0A4T0WZE4_9ASCO|nr:hypothetical protein CANINC_003147 [[Candida] inconspicua]
MTTVTEVNIPYFASLGMFIIDEIDLQGLHLNDVPGGAGTFAICGSRMILGAEESNRCVWFVDIGNDCPSEVLMELNSWNTGGIFRYDSTRRCTRGWNGYGPNELRTFKYLTPKKQIVASDLSSSPLMLQSKSIHLICSPERCAEVLDEINATAIKSGLKPNAVIAWEPVPEFCNSKNLDETLYVLSKIDIFTPNSAECASYFDFPEPTDCEGCEFIARRFVEHLTKPQSAVVLRCGRMGCLLMKSTNEPPIWFPAYHSNDQNEVIDPTGCGNTFVGAFATIASGACIEQHGPPSLTVSKEGDDLWNGLKFNDRLKRYIDRFSNMKKYMQ